MRAGEPVGPGEKALCDGPQSLTPEMFETLVHELRPIAKAVGLEMAK